MNMSYRTQERAWMPRTTPDWATGPASRKEAAQLWGDQVVHQHRLRRLGGNWTSKARWQCGATGRSPGLLAQSAPQLIGELCAAVDASRHLGKPDQAAARSAWRWPHSHGVVSPNQDARIHEGRLVLPHGTTGTLRIRLPETFV